MRIIIFFITVLGLSETLKKKMILVESVVVDNPFQEMIVGENLLFDSRPVYAIHPFCTQVTA